MPDQRNIIYSEPDQDGGTLVFLSTRVPLRTLLDYLETGRTLEEFLGNFPAVTRERAVAFLEEAVRRTESSEVNRIKKYDTAVLSGQAALRALLAMNGGATIAFLTFMGHLLDKETVSSPLQDASAFTGALQFFVYGTFAAVLGYGTIFLTNCFSYIGYRRTSNWMFGATMVCGLASLIYFLVASSRAIGGFTSR